MHSVLIHLLPGLALFAHRNVPVPEYLDPLWARVLRLQPVTHAPRETVGFFWIFGAPLLFYLVWQLLYFIIVQVGWACLQWSFTG